MDSVNAVKKPRKYRRLIEKIEILDRCNSLDNTHQLVHKVGGKLI